MIAQSSSDDTAAHVIEAARAWIGTPYHHQAALRGVGTDCLGLLVGVYRDVVGRAPEAAPNYTPDWAEALGRETLLEAADRHLLRMIESAPVRPGDVLIFRYRPGAPAKHCAIATAADRIIHAVERRGVVEVPLVPSWQRRIAGHFQFPAGAL